MTLHKSKTSIGVMNKLCCNNKSEENMEIISKILSKVFLMIIFNNESILVEPDILIEANFHKNKKHRKESTVKNNSRLISAKKTGPVQPF